MDDRELMQQTLEKLEFFAHMKGVSEDTARLIAALRERLAQPEQEPPVDVRAWFTIDEINAWADKKLKENPQWAAQPEQGSVKFNCTVVDDAHPEGVPLSQWGRQPLTVETVYETIIHWDEGGGKRSRRELARRIVALYANTGATP